MHQDVAPTYLVALYFKGFLAFRGRVSCAKPGFFWAHQNPEDEDETAEGSTLHENGSRTREDGAWSQTDGTSPSSHTTTRRPTCCAGRSSTGEPSSSTSCTRPAPPGRCWSTSW